MLIIIITMTTTAFTLSQYCINLEDYKNQTNQKENYSFHNYSTPLVFDNIRKTSNSINWDEYFYLQPFKIVTKTTYYMSLLNLRIKKSTEILHN